MARTSSSLELAISSLVEANQKVDVSNAFATYLILAGFSGLCDDAVVAFEHALEKHPETRLPYAEAVRELTTEYYSDKFGVPGTCGDGVCKQCAAYASTLDSPFPVEEKPRKKKKKNVTANVRKTKKTRQHATSDETPDPYRASTSAIV